jgi:NAD+ diphosphatase
MHTIFYLVFHVDNVALVKKGDTYELPQADDFEPVDQKHLYNIAQVDDKVYYAVEVEDASPYPTVEWFSLRQSCNLLDENFFPIVSKASQVIQWDKEHQFCSWCGSATTLKEKAWERQCVDCEKVFYPRISPSIIVLIKKEDHILMARGPHFEPGVYALIAGFVEPGETIEAATHREVQEEVGITIKNLRYYGSQSWPFPHSLMLAFVAEYEAGDIKIDETEIEAAGWYRKECLPGYPRTSLSIAAKLIQDFVDDKV